MVTCWRASAIKRMLVVLAILSVLSGGSIAAQGGGATCRPGSDPIAQNYLGYLQTLMTTTDTLLIRLRDSLYRLPVVPANQVALITDTQKCARAARAVKSDLEAGGLPLFQNVILIQVGTHYVVTDPSVRRGEFSLARVLDNQFKPGPAWIGG